MQATSRFSPISIFILLPPPFHAGNGIQGLAGIRHLPLIPSPVFSDSQGVVTWLDFKLPYRPSSLKVYCSHTHTHTRPLIFVLYDLLADLIPWMDSWRQLPLGPISRGHHYTFIFLSRYCWNLRPTFFSFYCISETHCEFCACGKGTLNNLYYKSIYSK